jgi:hypothetical protein
LADRQYFILVVFGVYNRQQLLRGWVVCGGDVQRDVVRVGTRRWPHADPFRPSLLNLENGDRFVIEHPEDMSLDVGSKGDFP